MAFNEKFVEWTTGTVTALVNAVNSVFGASGANHSVGLVPDPGSSSGTTRFLREDATWAVPSLPNTSQASGGNTTTNAINTGGSLANLKMCGYGFTYTPVHSTVLLVLVTCQVSSTAANDTLDFAICFGTGTAPVQNAAQTGTQVGGQQVQSSVSGSTVNNSSLIGRLTSLTIGVTYWFDIALGSRNTVATTSSIFNTFITLIEIK